jgi:hypothetical protein
VHRSGLPHIIVQPRKSVQDTCADGDKIAGLTPEAKFAAALKDASCPLAGYVLAMSNAFGFVLDDTSLRRAVVEGVPETVIAAIYLLHERSVGEVAAKLTPDGLEHVIRLVGRCPSCYPPGTLDALKSKRMALLTPTAGSLLSSGTAKRRAQPRHQHRRPSPRSGPSGQMQHRSLPHKATVAGTANKRACTTDASARVPPTLPTIPRQKALQD